MPSKVANAFYHSSKWQRCRAAYIAMRAAIDGGMCEVCHEEPGYIVHHKIWLDENNINNPDVTLNFDNLRYECLRCHNREEKDGSTKFQERVNQYAFDGEGNIVPLLDR